MDLLNARDESPQGRYRSEYRALDPIPMVAGKFAMAKVNCCLQMRECRWGWLGEKPAVILHLLTDMTQERNYSFQRCAIGLSFTRDEPNSTSPENYDSQDDSEAPRLLYPTFPANIKGTDDVQHRSNKIGINTEVGAGPATMGASLSRASDYEVRKSWSYVSHWEQGETGEYKNHYTRAVLCWTNEAPSRNYELNRLYSGLVLKHSSQPFRVFCSIDAKMSSLRGRIKKRFRSRNQEPQVTTIQIPKDIRITDDLTEAVWNLDSQIQRKINMVLPTIMAPTEYTPVSAVPVGNTPGGPSH